MESNYLISIGKIRLTLLLMIGTLALAGCPSSTGKGGLGMRNYAGAKVNAEGTFASVKSKLVRQAALDYPKAEREAVQQLPMELTGSDGTGLKLTGLAAKAVIQGPLAFTELHLTFHNPESRRREGRFTITLPPGAAISRFAMKIGGKWQEAEMVERQKARQIYEDFLHRRQDPALMEKKAGNQFRARVFPIPPNGDKELLVSYSQEIKGENDSYRMHLRGLPTVDSLKITAFVGQQQSAKGGASSLGGTVMSHQVVKVDKQNWAPDRDFIVKPVSGLAGLRHGNLAMLRIKPQLATGQAGFSSMLLLVDTSGSRAAGFYRQVEQLGAVIQHLKQLHGDDLGLHVACYDQMVGTVYEGPLGSFGKQELELILARRPLGASDLHGALGWAAKQNRFERVVLVTDGVVTAGKTDGAALKEAARGLAQSTKRMDVVLVGGIRDEAAMKSLVTGTLSEDGVLLDSDKPAKELAQRLSLRTVSGVRVTVPGAKWLWPRTLNGVQSGDEALVYADLPAGALPEGKPMMVQLSGPVSGQHQGELVTVKKPLLERAWVQARIAHLEHQASSGELGPDLQGAVKKQIIDLSTKHRVLSDYTALLVLETEADYRRYGLSRDSLGDILVVGQGEVDVINRKPHTEQPRRFPRPRPPVRRQPPVDRTKGQGLRPSRRSSRPTPDATLAEDASDSLVSAEKQEAAPRPKAAPAKRRASRPRRPVTRKPSSAPRPTPVMANASAGKAMAPRARRDRRTSVDFDDDQVEGELRRPAAESRPAPPMQVASAPPRRRVKIERKGPPPLTGKLAEIVGKIQSGSVEQALVDALRWWSESPGDLMALVALGEALSAYGNIPLAARVYGSIIDLFPSRADMRRFAGERLEALGAVGQPLALDTYGQAVKQRPDHASGHRLYGMALLRAGKASQALEALEAGVKQRYRIGRGGVVRILKEDMGLAAAALVAAEPNRRAELTKRLSSVGARISDQPSLRFVLNWETDANDVDFHIYDGQGGHAYYSSKSLPSGGALYADVTNGYGPECFTIPGKARTFPYVVQLHYYSRGPMGFGMGKLQIVEHNGQGKLTFEDRPFVVMNDKAFVDLGEVKGSMF